MTTPFGAPFPPSGPRSLTSVLVVDATLGFDVSRPPLGLALGATPASDNFIMREGALEPRSMLSAVGGTPQPMISRVLGGLEVVDVSGVRYAMISGITQLAYFSGATWSVASYTSAYGISDAPSGSATDYWDWTQIYSDLADQTIAVGCNASRQQLYAWEAGDTVFSTLTGSPGARCVASLDNYLVAANLGSSLVQRVQWSDRGSASSWTGGLSGFEDLLAAKGEIRRLFPIESRMLVFFDDETWYGVPVEFPFTFRFQPLDTVVGCPYPWTIVGTPRGVVFVARDFQVYLISKDGGAPQPIGQPLHRSIRDAIVQPARAWGVWDSVSNQYQLYYSTGGTNELPQRAAFLQMDTGTWAPQSFATNTMELTRGFAAQTGASRASVWNDFGAGSTWNSITGASNETWNNVVGRQLGNPRQTAFLGSSDGTMYILTSDVTSDAGTAVLSYWQTGPLEAGAPGAQKSISEIRLDYDATSASSVTVRTSPSQGVAFDTGTRTLLPAVSTVSQSVVYTRQPARYPVVRVESDGVRYRLHRLHVAMRVGGR